MHRLLLSPAAAPLLALTIVCVTNVLAYPHDHATQMAWFWENGPVENLSVAGYLVVILWLVVRALGEGGQRRFLLHSALVMALPAARELDLHKAFTSDGISKSRFYLDPGIPLWEKMFGLAAILIMLVLLISYARHYWRPFVDGLRRGNPAHLTTAFGIAMLPLSKGMDTLVRLLRDFGYQVDEHLSSVIGINEETIEMTIPLFFLVALYQYHTGQNTRV